MLFMSSRVPCAQRAVTRRVGWAFTRLGGISLGMKAVGYRKSLPIEDAESLIDFETAKPEPKGRDVRVAVKAISANPVDYKVRKRAAPPEGETKILGYDAAGIVDAVGPDVTCYQPTARLYSDGVAPSLKRRRKLAKIRHPKASTVEFRLHPDHDRVD